jgi:cell division protein FtsI (penicillin-binding protein 3)
VDPASRRRATLLGAAFCGLFLALLARLYAVQVAGHETQLARRDAQVRAVAGLPASRSAIYDRGGQVLACSIPVDSVWVDPSALSDRPAAARLLAAALRLRPEAVLENLNAHVTKRFVWVKRRVSADEARDARALLEHPVFRVDRKSSPEPKLGFSTEFARRYPFGSLLSHVLGHDSEDPASKEGAERSLDPWLESRARTFEIRVDGRRSGLDGPRPEAPGAEAVLTLDILLQKVVEEELDAACAEFRPRWAVAVALDPRSGAVLAIANRPAFDPNRPTDSSGDARRNRALTDPYEPGSTLKPFVAAWALDLGVATPDTRIDCEHGLWKHGARLLHDHHPYGTISLAEVIIHSSNIGAAKIGALMLGRARTWECMRRWGFGSRTGIDLPAEDDGRLFPLAKWNEFSDTSVPMGHEIAVTPLQLVAAMSAIANGGTLYRPYVVRRLVAADGTVVADPGPQAVRRVIGEKAAREMTEILRRVVAEGTGRKAQVPGVDVAGKTGTSQKIDPVTKKYTHEKYISSFVGFAPAEAPRMCVAVILDEPQGAYYGGSTAAPAVGKIVQRGLVHVK